MFDCIIKKYGAVVHQLPLTFCSCFCSVWLRFPAFVFYPQTGHPVVHPITRQSTPNIANIPDAYSQNPPCHFLILRNTRQIRNRKTAPPKNRIGTDISSSRCFAASNGANTNLYNRLAAIPTAHSRYNTYFSFFCKIIYLLPSSTP